MSVVTAYVPQQSRELLAYMSLILRTARRFGRRAWLEYDRAFRQEAAISGSKDWHIMRADLYNFHTAGANKPVSTPPFRRPNDQARSIANHGEICRSWNRGKCSSKFTSCSYQHVCDIKGCGGGYRSIEWQHNYVNGIAEHRRSHHHTIDATHLILVNYNSQIEQFLKHQYPCCLMFHQLTRNNLHVSSPCTQTVIEPSMLPMA